MRTSAEQMTFLHRVASWYLKLFTSNFWPFMLMFARMLFVVLVLTVLFSVLTPILYAFPLSMNLSVRSCSSPLLPLKRTMSPVKLHMGLPSVEMDMCGGHGVFPA